MVPLIVRTHLKQLLPPHRPDDVINGDDARAGFTHAAVPGLFEDEKKALSLFGPSTGGTHGRYPPAIAIPRLTWSIRTVRCL